MSVACAGILQQATAEASATVISRRRVPHGNPRKPRQKPTPCPLSQIRPLQRHLVGQGGRLLSFGGGEEMDGASRGLGLAAIERCTAAWEEIHARIGRRFARAEARE